MISSLPSKIESFFEMMQQGDEFVQHGFGLLSKRSEPEQYFDALNENGFFDPAHNSGPVPSTNPDLVHIPVWPALGYLEAVAKRAGETDDGTLSEKILQVIRNVSHFRDQSTGAPRDNYQTYFRFSEILGILPTRFVKIDDVNLIRYWLPSRYNNGLVTYSLGKGLLRRLLASDTEDDIKKACALVDLCMAFEWSSEPARDRRHPSKQLTTIVDDYWLKEMLDSHARELGAKANTEAVKIFEQGLRMIFSDQRRSYGSTLWRPAIEPSGQNLDWHGAENRFVEGLRDALQGWIEVQPGAAVEYAARALTDESEIIRRIALYISTEHFDLLREKFETIIRPELFTSGHRHELYRLLSERFNEMSAVGRAAVIGSIRKLPPPSAGEDLGRRLKFIQRDWLSSIKNHAEATDWFSELATDPELGSVSDHPDFLNYHESRWGPGPAPFGAESLIAFAEDGTLVDRLNGFIENDSWRGPTLGGLIAALESAVAANPDTFLPLIGSFHEAKIAFQHAFIQGFKRLFDTSNDKKPEFDWKIAWPKLMAFFSQCVFGHAIWGPSEEQNRIDLVPTNGWMRSLISNFLEAGTRDDKTAYPPDLLPQGWVIIKTLLDRAPESELSLNDPMTHALNTEKGHAIGAMYNHALRVRRLEKAASNNIEQAWASLKETFDAEIGKCRNANFEFSTLSASYIANLEFMSRQWLADNGAALFPAVAYPNNFKAAIGGLAYGTPTRWIYQLLASNDVFLKALSIKLEDKSGREKVIEWISLAYLWDDEEMESPIIRHVFSAGAGDLETMSDFFWGARGDRLTEKQKSKVLAFWDRCLIWAKSRQTIPEQLMAHLSRLSSYLEVLDETSRILLLAVVPYVHNDYSTDKMVEEISRLSDSNPAIAVEILECMLGASAPTYDFNNKLRELIEKLAALGQREEAIRCVEKVRKTLPGMLDLYRKLIAAH